MNLHYLDPKREPRDCFCDGGTCHSNACRCDGKGDTSHVHTACNGTGRLGVEGAEPDVEVASVDGYGFRFRKPGGALGCGFGGWSHDSYPTPEAALAAARREKK